MLTTAELAGAFQPERRGLLARLLGFVPVPTPPNVFEVDSTVLRFASFERRA